MANWKGIFFLLDETLRYDTLNELQAEKLFEVYVLATIHYVHMLWKEENNYLILAGSLHTGDGDFLSFHCERELICGHLFGDNLKNA